MSTNIESLIKSLRRNDYACETAEARRLAAEIRDRGYPVNVRRHTSRGWSILQLTA